MCEYKCDSPSEGVQWHEKQFKISRKYDILSFRTTILELF